MGVDGISEVDVFGEDLQVLIQMRAYGSGSLLVTRHEIVLFPLFFPCAVSSGIISLPASPSVYGSDEAVEELSVSINPHFHQLIQNLARDGDIVDNKIISEIEKEVPDHTLDLSKFPGYMHSKPTKRPRRG